MLPTRVQPWCSARTSEHSCGVTEALLRAWQEDLRLVAREAMKPSISDEGDGEWQRAVDLRTSALVRVTGAYQWGLEGARSFQSGERQIFTCWKMTVVVRAHFPYIFGTTDMQCICSRTYVYQNSSLWKQSSIIQFHLPSYLEDAESNSCSPAQPI
jgi:hypothetical protein